MSDRPNPFIIGSSVPPDSPVYVEREADRQLLESCLNGESVHVQAPRFLGKTSLLLRAARRLQTENVPNVIIDLETLPSLGAGNEQWYERLIEEIGRGLLPRVNLSRLWTRLSELPVHKDKTPIQRLAALLEDVIPQHFTKNPVLFFDGIEALSSFDSPPDFYQLHRYYEDKRQNPRFSLVTAGYRQPRERDGFPTISLWDFTREEVTPLVHALDVPYEVMGWILDWTDGHPLLTQRLCSAIFEDNRTHWSPDDVSDVVKQIFLGEFLFRDTLDSDIQYIGRALTKSQHGIAALRQYQRVFDDPRSYALDGTLAYLIEIGLLKFKGPGGPQIRNRIYQEVFDEIWVAQQLKLSDSFKATFSGRDLTFTPGGFTVAQRYRLEEHVGVAGDVYLARDQKTQRQVAVRIISAHLLIPDRDYQSEAVTRFETELRNVASLRHPNVVDIVEFGFSDEGYFYVVMEYVSDGNLLWFLGNSGQLNIDFAILLLSQIVAAIDAAHEVGIVHGHLTPRNIFVSSRPGDKPFVKVGDFGQASLMNKGANSISTQPPMEGEVGDPLYLAPEQILANQAAWDQRADIYALGMIAYQMLGGQLPEFQNLSNIIAVKQERRLVSLTAVRSDITEQFETALMQALAYDPNQRPPSAGAWLALLQASLSTPASALTVQGPPGASVYIDGIEQGIIGDRNPLKLEVQVGPHNLLVTKSGQEYHDQILVERDRPLMVSSDFPFESAPPHQVVVYFRTSLSDSYEEKTALRTALFSLRHITFGGLRWSEAPEIHFQTHDTPLKPPIFLGVIGQSVGSRALQQQYLYARQRSVPRFIYIKRMPPVNWDARPDGPDILPVNEFEDFKNQLLSDGVASFFDSTDELVNRFTDDLTKWLSNYHLRNALKHASDDRDLTLLLDQVQNQEILDKNILDEVRLRVESERNYLFFFSYSDAELDYFNVRQFFEDLDDEVRRLTATTGRYAGVFHHKNISHERDDESALYAESFRSYATALQNSRVLVPLYTPNYFKSELCGKVWQYFQLRAEAALSTEANAGLGSPPPIILPVLWSPNESLPDPLPPSVRNVQYLDFSGSSGELYSYRGLRYLDREHKNEYKEFVRRFAQRLVDVSQSYSIPPLANIPDYSQLPNPFSEPSFSSSTPESETPTVDEKARPYPPAGGWIAVAGSGSTDLSEKLQTISFEVGKEIARRGYGLVTGGWNGVDYFVHQGFAAEFDNEQLLRGAVKIIRQTEFQPAFSGGTTMLVGGPLSDTEEEVKQADAVVLIGGEGGTYDFYPIAERLGKPVFPIFGTGGDAERVYLEMTGTFQPDRLPRLDLLGIAEPLESNTSIRRVIQALLDAIDNTWPSSKPTRTKNEALSCIAFIRGDLLDQEADAIVNSVGQDPANYDEIGEATRLGPKGFDELLAQGELKTGETITTRLRDFNSPYVIHVCSESDAGSHTLESVVQAVTGALKRADALRLESIAFPSMGTGAAGLGKEPLSKVVLEAVAEHLRKGSNLGTIIFVLHNDSDYRAYLNAFLGLGGKPAYRVLIPSLSHSSRRALLYADALRNHLGRKRISSSTLLWGLYQKESGATRELLISTRNSEDIQTEFQKRLNSADMSLLGIEPAPESRLPYLRFSPNCDAAFVEAKELAGEAIITERQLLAGLIAVSQAHGTKWLSEVTEITQSELFEIIAVRGEERAEAIRVQIESRRQAEVTVATTSWTLSLSTPESRGQSPHEFMVGERVTLTLALQSFLANQGEEAPQNLLRIPMNSLELTGYIKAPACQLQVESLFTIKLTNGVPEETNFSFDFKPLLSGVRTVEVEIYPGGHISDLGPTIIKHQLTVSPPVVLPDIRELIDRRQIPYPQPDVMLYVALEETSNGQRTRLYLTCPLLQLDRYILEPLELNQRDIAELRSTTVETASMANGVAPRSALAVLRSLGATLFDRLVNGKFEEYFQQISTLAAISNRRWSWFVISDENAILPWELVCYYGTDNEGNIQHDEFLADKFLISHWVGQRGFRLMNNAPMGNLDLVHYNQRSEALSGWTNAIGDELVTVESDADQMSLLKPGSYCYGLHLLRYAREQTKLIVAMPEAGKLNKLEGEAIAGDQKLDLTLRRPTVGLSLINDQLASTPGLARFNSQLESSWMLPFMEAGASALFGPRWPVSVEADQAFVREFYDSMRQGETLGTAFFNARAKLRARFPERTDWLAYSYFGHPYTEPYVVQPSQGFTLVEALDQPQGEHFVGGATYRFRASYRTEAPAWYEGRLQIQEGEIPSEEMSVTVMPLSGVQPTTYQLEPVAQSNELQKTFSITMPDESTTMPVMVRFQQQAQELRTMILNLQIKGDL